MRIVTKSEAAIAKAFLKPIAWSTSVPLIFIAAIAVAPMRLMLFGEPVEYLGACVYASLIIAVFAASAVLPFAWLRDLFFEKTPFLKQRYALLVREDSLTRCLRRFYDPATPAH